jgi:hypothetical protein
MAEGWISIYRQIRDNDLWQDKPFTRGQAWIDLLLLANHTDKISWPGGSSVEVKRGSFVTSELKLMKLWGWSKSKVRLFLFELEKQQMIVKKSDTKKTTISICKYEIYQNRETTKRPKKDYKKTTERLQKDTTNNDIIMNNNDNNHRSKKMSPDEYKKKVKEWFDVNSEKIESENFPIWEAAYPDVNIRNETNAAYSWLISNEIDQKSNFKSFLNNWLNNANKRRLDNGNR